MHRCWCTAHWAIPVAHWWSRHGCCNVGWQRRHRRRWTWCAPCGHRSCFRPPFSRSWSNSAMPSQRDSASPDKDDTATHPVAWGVLTAFLRTGKDADHASSVLLLGTLLLYVTQFPSYLASLVVLLALLLAL